MSEPAAHADYSRERCVRPGPMLSALLRDDPLNVIGRLAVAEHYETSRLGANMLDLLVPGFWCDHALCFEWEPESERLSVAITFDARMTQGRSDEMFRLLGLLNGGLAAGHFDYHAPGLAGTPRSLIYRNSIDLAGGAGLRIEQAMSLVASAVDAAETGYPAFQYCIWAGASPEEALDRAHDDLLRQR